MKVTAVMTCFNRKLKTEKCLKSLVDGNPSVKFSFVVVDDNSTDDTVAMLQNLKNDYNIHVINGSGNLYYSGGMRIGIDHILKYYDGADYIMLFNDDVDFYESSIEHLIEMDTKQQMILVGATEDEDGNLTYGGVIKKSRYAPRFQIVMSGEQIQYCDTFNANCVLIPYGIFVKLGNIDKRYVHSLGDFDYGLAASKKEYKIVASDFYVGSCCNNPRSNTWLDKTLPIMSRLKKKESPKGQPLKIWFHFINKNYNFVSACLYSLNDYIKILVRR